MARYIDADELAIKFRMVAEDPWNKSTSTTWANAYEECADEVDEFPTADVVERKHGKWEKMWHSYFKQELPCCSVCGHFSEMRWKYCPNCGAKMDGKEETNDKD